MGMVNRLLIVNNIFEENPKKAQKVVSDLVSNQDNREIISEVIDNTRKEVIAELDIRNLDMKDKNTEKSYLLAKTIVQSFNKQGDTKTTLDSFLKETLHLQEKTTHPRHKIIFKD
jgi:Mg/Co/Ni transporter MgtE